MIQTAHRDSDEHQFRITLRNVAVGFSAGAAGGLTAALATAMISVGQGLAFGIVGGVTAGLVLDLLSRLRS